MKNLKKIIIFCVLSGLSISPLFAFGYPVHDFMSLTQAVLNYKRDASEALEQVATWAKEAERWKTQLEQITRYYQELESSLSGIDWGDLGSIWDGLNNAFGSLYDITEEMQSMEKQIEKKAEQANQNYEKLKEEQLTREEKAYTNLYSSLAEKYNIEDPNLSHSEKLSKQLLLYKEMSETLEKEASDLLNNIKNDYAYKGEPNNITGIANSYSGYRNARDNYYSASKNISKTIFMGSEIPAEWVETTGKIKEDDDESWLSPYVDKVDTDGTIVVYEAQKISPETLKEEAKKYIDSNGKNPPSIDKYNFAAIVQIGISARTNLIYNEKTGKIEAVGKDKLNQATKEDLEAMVEHFKIKQAEAKASADTARRLQKRNEDYKMKTKLTLKTKIQIYEDTLTNLQVAKENLKEVEKQYDEYMQIQKLRDQIKNDENTNIDDAGVND